MQACGQTLLRRSRRGGTLVHGVPAGKHIRMIARYAVYDTFTDRDVGEFTELSGAYTEIDRLTRHHGARYGVRVARQHRERVDQSWKIRTAGRMLRLVTPE
jgi:hypothetical protein